MPTRLLLYATVMMKQYRNHIPKTNFTHRHFGRSGKLWLTIARCRSSQFNDPLPPLPFWRKKNLINVINAEATYTNIWRPLPKNLQHLNNIVWVTEHVASLLVVTVLNRNEDIKTKIHLASYWWALQGCLTEVDILFWNIVLIHNSSDSFDLIRHIGSFSTISS